MNSRKSGYLVETKDGKLGRTFHENELINGKIPVYLAEETKEKEINGLKLKVVTKYSDQGTLCAIKSLKIKGFID